MKKIFLFSLIFLAVTALMSSCVNPDKLTFGGIESIQIKGVSTSQIGVDVGIRATNSSSHNVTLTDMQIEIKRQGTTQLTFNLREKSVVPRKSDGVVTFPLVIRFNGLLGALGAYSTFSKGLEGVTVSGYATIKAGWMKKRLDIPEMPLDELARQSGIDPAKLLQEQFAQ